MIFQRTQQGFTLIEALVAISILVLAIIGPMTIAARGLQAAFFATEQLTATYLAQEGAELIRMRREEYVLENVGGGTTDNWLTALPASCESAAGCGVDVRDLTGTPLSCAVSADTCRLRYNESDVASSHRGMYTYTGINYSPYTRKIRITEEETGSNEVIVESEVSWQSGIWGTRKSVILRTRLFDHYDAY